MSSLKNLKEYLEKIEVSINSQLEDIKGRLGIIEESTLPSEKCQEILKKIEDKGNEITALNKTISDQIKEDIIKIRDVVIKRLREENRTLRSKISNLETRVLENERATNKSDQHSRKVNFEIDGIPDSVDQDSLKETAVQILKEAGVDHASCTDIEVIHGLESRKTPKPTIIKARRDFIDRVFEKKKSIINVGVKMGYDESVKLYVNRNLCPAYCKIAFNCRQLKKKKLIEDTWSTTNGVVKIKTITGAIKTLTHQADLVKLFPDYDEFTFNKTIYKDTFAESFDSFDDADMDNYAELSGW